MKVLLFNSKFRRLGDMDRRYFSNVERVKKLARELGSGAGTSSRRA